MRRRFTLSCLALAVVCLPAPAADLVITATSVAGSITATRPAGGTTTAGQGLYFDGTNVWPTDPTFAGGSKAICVGVALNGGAASQPISYQGTGQVTIGATVAIGTIYVCSHNAAGKIAPWADLVSTDYVTIVGIAPDTTHINLALNATGIQHAFRLTPANRRWLAALETYYREVHGWTPLRPRASVACRAAWQPAACPADRASERPARSPLSPFSPRTCSTSAARSRRNGETPLSPRPRTAPVLPCCTTRARRWRSSSTSTTCIT